MQLDAVRCYRTEFWLVLLSESTIYLYKTKSLQIWFFFCEDSKFFFLNLNKKKQLQNARKAILSTATCYYIYFVNQAFN